MTSTAPIAEMHLQVLDPEEWVDAYGDYLYRYAHSRLRDSNAAEEVLQETFLAGIRHQDQFAGQGTQRAWLLGILKRKIIDHVRARAKYDSDGSYEDDWDPSNQLFDQNGRWKEGALPQMAPSLRLEGQELWSVVQDCLERIPPRQADVFVLTIMEEMGTDEVCHQLDITPSNLWVRLHRARLALAKCVGSKWFSAGEDSEDAQ